MAFSWPFDAPLSDRKRRGIILESWRLAVASASSAGAYAPASFAPGNGRRGLPLAGAKVEFYAAVGETLTILFSWQRQRKIPQAFSNEVNHA